MSFAALPSKPKHTESDHVVVNDDKPKGPMKRKVISSTHAPSYKGKIYDYNGKIYDYNGKIYDYKG